VQASGGKDSAALTDADYLGNADAKTGIFALLKTDIFNMLVIARRTGRVTHPRPCYPRRSSCA